MNSRNAPPPVQRLGNDAPPPAGPSTSTARSVRVAGLTAGLGILLMSALAAFGNFVAIEGVVTHGDAAGTAQGIAGAETLFRFGIGSLLLVIVLDVVVAWALYRVFAPVDEGVSKLAAWFRLAYAAVFMVAVARLLEALRLLDGESLAALPTEQRQAGALSHVEAFVDLWDAGLLLFGCHLLLIGYLAYRSGVVPRLIGILLVVAGAGYVVDSLLVVLHDGPLPAVSAVTFLGEFLLALWLVARSARLAAVR